jgi:tetraacyldisaccharide 4'-kinase
MPPRVVWSVHRIRVMASEGWREILSGRRRDATARLVRALLWPVSLVYGLVVVVRNAAYDRRWLAVHAAAVPVISVGNLTTGGTGKTPVVAWLAGQLRQRGWRPTILSRGYGAGDAAVNDEALVLEALCPDVPHLQQPDRVAAARIAVDELESDVLLLDDGFQHRRLNRDLDLVLIDCLEPWGGGGVLPFGLLREPVAGLKRAKGVLLTRCDQVEAPTLESIGNEVRRHNPSAVIASVAFHPTRLLQSGRESQPAQRVRGQRVAVFCAIGHPAAFLQTVQSLEAVIVDTRTFPDHHRFSRVDVEDLVRWVQTTKPDAVLCTQKDLVKLQLADLGGTPLFAVEIATVFHDGESELVSLIESAVGTKKPETFEETSPVE